MFVTFLTPWMAAFKYMIAIPIIHRRITSWPRNGPSRVASSSTTYLPELSKAFGAREGVPKAVIKVSARSKVLSGWGWWNSWGQVTTKADGSFTVSENHGGDRRQFKVEVLFDSDRLRLKEGQETSIRLDGHGFPLDVEFDLTDKDWFEVHDDENDGAPTVARPGHRPRGHRRHRCGGPSARRHVVPLRPGHGPDRRLRSRLRVRQAGHRQVPDGNRRQRPASASYNNPATSASTSRKASSPAGP